MTVFHVVTAINDGTTAEPHRSWRCHCGLYRTRTAVAPRLRCDGGCTAEARRNMFKVFAVHPRRSAVLTVFRGATAINRGTTAKSRRSWRYHCGLCRTRTAVAPRLRCDGGSTAEARRNMFKVSAVNYQKRSDSMHQCCSWFVQFHIVPIVIVMFLNFFPI